MSNRTISQASATNAEISDLQRQVLHQYRLTTASILYHMPDHPGLLQTYVWQDYDLAPRYPMLHKFLDFWSHNLDGKLHSVEVASHDLIAPARIRHAEVVLTLQ